MSLVPISKSRTAGLALFLGSRAHEMQKLLRDAIDVDGQGYSTIQNNSEPNFLSAIDDRTACFVFVCHNTSKKSGIERVWEKRAVYRVFEGKWDTCAHTASPRAHYIHAMGVRTASPGLRGFSTNSR